MNQKTLSQEFTIAWQARAVEPSSPLRDERYGTREAIELTALFGHLFAVEPASPLRPARTRGRGNWPGPQADPYNNNNNIDNNNNNNHSHSHNHDHNHDHHHHNNNKSEHASGNWPLVPCGRTLTRFAHGKAPSPPYLSSRAREGPFSCAQCPWRHKHEQIFRHKHEHFSRVPYLSSRAREGPLSWAQCPW